METRKCEFHKIKVEKAQKFIHKMALSKVIYRGTVAVHFRCSSTDGPPLYLLPPNKFY